MRDVVPWERTRRLSTIFSSAVGHGPCTHVTGLVRSVRAASCRPASVSSATIDRGARCPRQGGRSMKLRQVGAVFAAASLVLAACGDDDDEGGDDTATEATDAPEGTEAPAQPRHRPRPKHRLHRGTGRPRHQTSTEAPATTAAKQLSDVERGTGTQPAEGEMIIQPGECGLNTGEAATGDPIKLGGAGHEHPRRRLHVDPEDGRHLLRLRERERRHLRPPDRVLVRGRRSPTRHVPPRSPTKLVEEDQVLAIVGNTALIECDVNGDYYAEHGYYPIIAGVAQGCFTNPQLVGRQHGPVLLEPRRCPGRGASRCHGQDRRRLARQPGMDFNNSGVDGLRRDRRAWRARASSRPCRSPTRPASPSAWCRRPAKAAAWCSTSPARRCCRCSRRSSSRV